MLKLGVRRRQLCTFGWFLDGPPGRNDLLPDHLPQQTTRPHFLGFPTGGCSVGDRVVCRLDQELLHFRSIRRVLVVPIPVVYTHKWQQLL